VNNKLEGIWTEAGLDIIGIFSRNLPGGTEENHINFSQYIASAPSEIRTEHLSNTNVEIYSFTSQLDN
jgi:hypothetical protein